MVGPSITDDERRDANNKLQLGFVLLVGISGGLVATQAGASLLQTAVAVAGGLVLGGVLLLWLRRWSAQFRRETNRRQSRR
jgi:undecaprenyl pyrophosphate phosphatase UppP